MKLEIDGEAIARCNLCTNDTNGDDYCEKCKQDCYDRCSEEVDNICLEFDLDLTYQMMAKVLSDRGYW